MNEDDRTRPGQDPLAGSDPWPLAHLDLLPLADERAELLEEIVSTEPHAPPANRTPWLVAAAAVVVLALVGGGIWLARGDDSADDPTTVAAGAGSEDTTEATDPTEADATEPDDAPDDAPDTVPADEAGKGDRIEKQECRALLDGRRRSDWTFRVEKKLSELRAKPSRDRVLVIAQVRTENGRWLAIDRTCRVRAVGKNASDLTVLLTPDKG